MEHINRDISILYRYGQKFLAERFAAFGLEVGQFPVLIYALKHPGMTQDQIAASSCIDKSAVARAAQKLETAGLLYREVDMHDRRVNHVYPTARAKACEAQIEAVLDELHTVMYAGLPPEEVAQAVALTAKMCSNLAASCAKERADTDPV